MTTDNQKGLAEKLIMIENDRLMQIAELLKLPPSFFVMDATAKSSILSEAENTSLALIEEGRLLLSAFLSIKDGDIRRQLSDLVASFAKRGI